MAFSETDVLPPRLSRRLLPLLFSPESFPIPALWLTLSSLFFIHITVIMYYLDLGISSYTIRASPLEIWHSAQYDECDRYRQESLLIQAGQGQLQILLFTRGFLFQVVSRARVAPFSCCLLSSGTDHVFPG
jgi:hypothetical protein